jgi:tripartite-type tricarboxylate transporter receptor subunit TctC
LLAITNRRRSLLAPDTPTAIEAGYPQLAFDGLQGFFGPRDITIGRRERIAADIRAVAGDPVVADLLAAVGQIARGNTPAEFATEINEQRA